MINVGITGESGFIGYHLANNIRLRKDELNLINFERAYFSNEDKLDEFVSQCDVIFHLAAMNRHDDPQVIYETNIALGKKLLSSLKRTNSKAHVLLSSTTQEDRDNLYGQSKKECRLMFADWAVNSNGKFTGLIIPNVFGPFGAPFYNSFIATFCYLLTRGQEPTIHEDSRVNLIYIQDLVEIMLNCLNRVANNEKFVVEHTSSILVSEVLLKLKNFEKLYYRRGAIPELSTKLDLDLFNTYRSFIDLKEYFPAKYTLHSDDRGSFVELVRIGAGGQVSFSTTKPGIVRGNHFHTRKIERFSVVKGQAIIEMRRIGQEEKLSFEISGDNPAYVDMPIWYTHNIKNIGEQTLYTVFWINEQYNPEDADTYFENV